MANRGKSLSLQTSHYDTKALFLFLKWILFYIFSLGVRIRYEYKHYSIRLQIIASGIVHHVIYDKFFFKNIFY